jgi:N-acetylmuramoyl-L-alanine amidase
MSQFKEFSILMISIFLLVCSIALIDVHIDSVFLQQTLGEDSKYTVVIDAGHGGFDSGKVGVDGTLEKDVNLSIAKKLEALLLASDVRVIMVRKDDHGLYKESSPNKKREDMAARASIMNPSNVDCIISIQQNSYTQESVDGAQVFYYTDSEDGKNLASLIQNSLIQRADPSNHRQEKPNNSYYLLKYTQNPIVIVECGFLSNWSESKKLVDDTYQQTLAWAIHLGVLQYLNGVAANLHISK